MPAIWSGRFVRALDSHGQSVFPGAERFGHIESEGFEIAGMMPKVLTVEVYICEIIHAIEMDGGKLPARAVVEFMAEPDDTVMVKPAQEPVLRDVHARPGRIIKGRLAELWMIFGGIAPEAVQIVAD
jgi:hypothetical protein